MRADVDQGVKVYTSKKVLQSGDTCLILISFQPESSGGFKKRIGLVTSDQATPYEIYLSGTLSKLKQDDKTACFYFGARRNSGTTAREEPLIVAQPDEARDRTNRIPDPQSAVTSTPPTRRPSERTENTIQPSPDPALLSDEYKPNNIVFLVDVSGSMRDSLKLPLMKNAMHTLINAVRDVDRICLVTYADTVKVIKEGINGADKQMLHSIVDSLRSRGQTKGNKAILFSQQLAQRYFIEGGNNQILLATDGKFRFHPKDQATWASRQQNKKIILSTVAFGSEREAMANLKDIAKIGGGTFIHIKKRNGSQDKLLEEIKQRSRR